MMPLYFSPKPLQRLLTTILSIIVFQFCALRFVSMSDEQCLCTSYICLCTPCVCNQDEELDYECVLDIENQSVVVDAFVEPHPNQPSVFFITCKPHQVRSLDLN